MRSPGRPRKNGDSEDTDVHEEIRKVGQARDHLIRALFYLTDFYQRDHKAAAIIHLDLAALRLAQSDTDMATHDRALEFLRQMSPPARPPGPYSGT